MGVVRPIRNEKKTQKLLLSDKYRTEKLVKNKVLFS